MNVGLQNFDILAVVSEVENERAPNECEKDCQRDIVVHLSGSEIQLATLKCIEQVPNQTNSQYSFLQG